MHVGHPVRDAKSKRNSILMPVEQNCLQRLRYKLVLELAGLGFGEVWASLGWLLGVTWPAFGNSWAAPGLSWTPLKPFLDALGRLLVALGHFLGAFCLPGPPRASIYKRFQDVRGLVWEGFGRMFWHAFCCASHFETKCVYSCRNHVFSFTGALHSFPSGAAVCAQHMESTHNAARIDV